MDDDNHRLFQRVAEKLGWSEKGGLETAEKQLIKSISKSRRLATGCHGSRGAQNLPPPVQLHLLDSEEEDDRGSGKENQVSKGNSYRTKVFMESSDDDFDQFLVEQATPKTASRKHCSAAKKVSEPVLVLSSDSDDHFENFLSRVKTPKPKPKEAERGSVDSIRNFIVDSFSSDDDFVVERKKKPTSKGAFKTPKSSSFQTPVRRPLSQCDTPVFLSDSEEDDGIVMKSTWRTCHPVHRPPPPPQTHKVNVLQSNQKDKIFFPSPSPPPLPSLSPSPPPLPFLSPSSPPLRSSFTPSKTPLPQRNYSAPSKVEDSASSEEEFLSLLDRIKKNHKTGNTPTPKHNTGNTPTPKHNTANTPTPKHNTANTPTPKHNTANTPTPKHNTANTPTPKHNTANTPTPKHNTGPNQKPPLSAPRQKASKEVCPRPLVRTPLDLKTPVRPPVTKPTVSQPESRLKTSSLSSSSVSAAGCQTPGCFLQSLSGPGSIYSRNFKQTKEELTTKLYHLYNTSVFNNKLPSNMSVSWNNKMRKTAGYCITGQERGGGNRYARIQLSEKVCDSADRLRDTLVHEMCHAATWLINSVRDGHGPFWKLYARKATLAHPELPVVTRCHSYDINYKYQYQCSRCKNTLGRHSKSLDTQRFVCAVCTGPLVLLTPAKPRAPTPFANFVKENYGSVRQNLVGQSHGEVMRKLSVDFATKAKLSQN
ncbi:acidic repeat-containing protein-like isoform X1 [Salvelinus namaycush]|uniref:Acidic repeat-containing protein-like isoform X1 n=1 Tax=Salvelinus namaycush TaxID=8040 RepID=A0A8U1F1W9_SALNM|nr:acidic repeat-containing protein-like isoform X1 [Salvelinus namaycush]